MLEIELTLTKLLFYIVEVVDRTTNLGDGATGQPGEEEESWEDQGEDKGETDRGEQEGDVAHGVCCSLKGSIRAIRYVKILLSL